MMLVLASTSPRRRELLAQAGLGGTNFCFTQVAPEIDETAFHNEKPSAYVQRLAVEKAQKGVKLCQSHAQRAVLGSDTIVVLNQQILGKPKDAADAKRMLSALSGQSHTVMTAVALTIAAGNLNTECSAEVLEPQMSTLVRLVTTQVHFCVLSNEDIDAYVATQEPMDKAGGYGIQGLGGCFVSAIQGSYSAVVGLPLVETRALLREAGLL